MTAKEVSLNMLQTDFTFRDGVEKKRSGKNLQIKHLATPYPVTCISVIICSFITILVIIISLVLKERSTMPVLEYPVCAACPEQWIGFGNKCFYFSDDTRNWTHSQAFCASLKSQLVQFETLEELKFLKRYKGLSDHWIGLSRESSHHIWKWTDNTEYNATNFYRFSAFKKAFQYSYPESSLGFLYNHMSDNHGVWNNHCFIRMFGPVQNPERSMMQKPPKHPHHCQHKWARKDYPECPKWHLTALRVTSIALVILVATVIGLTLWVCHLRIHSFSDNYSMKMFGSENGTKDCDCMNIPPRKQLGNTNFTTNPRLNLCPNDWVQEKGKCYKFFKNFESWIDTQKFCSIMKSHLLMIQDKAELDFIQNNIQDGIYFWIALNITYPQKTWTWLDGTPLNPQLFQVTGQVEDNACAVITKKGVFSEKCHSHNYWICQDVVSSDDGL
ncbi:uncharacterized protein LOC120611706 isoform X2 [Pteropus medius]|uniref:uncharacterized protein LOC120611706 isoform X2 n=1 Tax=Pteropus vampyrus TaxID=132908 RepID=UPI00196AFBA2|nr:uncharacterized protein LOC120611706 isoform X2 [Pteropus giganteus]